MNEDDIAQQQQAYAGADEGDGETAEDQFKKKKRKMLEEVSPVYFKAIRSEVLAPTSLRLSRDSLHGCTTLAAILTEISAGKGRAQQEAASRKTELSNLRHLAAT